MGGPGAIPGAPLPSGYPVDRWWEDEGGEAMAEDEGSSEEAAA